MKILHFIKEKENPYNGIFVVAPKHVIFQGKYADVKIISLNGINLKIPNQIFVELPFKLEDLPSELKKTDIVIFHGCFYLDFIKIAKQFKRQNIPYIIIPHGSFSIESQRKKWLKKLLYRYIYLNQFVKSAAAIQYLSQGEKDNSIYSRKKSFIGANGIEEHNDEQQPHGNPDNITISFIGRWDIYHKGLDILCDACSKIKKFLLEHNVSLNLYGPTYKHLHEKMRALVSQYDIRDIVTLNGPVSGRDKENILKKTDIFIQTSRFEGLPMGILEALSYGLPCLITYGTNLGEIVNNYNAGWVCIADAEAIASSIKEAVSETFLYSVKSQNAKRLIKENYTWDIVGKHAIEYYKTLLSESQ